MAIVTPSTYGKADVHYNYVSGTAVKRILVYFNALSAANGDTMGLFELYPEIQDIEGIMMQSTESQSGTAWTWSAGTITFKAAGDVQGIVICRTSAGSKN